MYTIGGNLFAKYLSLFVNILVKIVYYPLYGFHIIFYCPAKKILEHGTQLKKWIERFHTNKLYNISNMEPTLFNGNTYQIRFSANEKKYQLTLEGDFGEKYKNLSQGEKIANDDEMFETIKDNRRLWFLRKSLPGK